VKTIIAAMIGTASLLASSANAQDRPQIPWGESEAQTGADRLYTADQFSNTVTVIDPVEGKTLGIIKLGELQPANFGALYKGQLLVHGLGFSPDGKTLAVVSVGSNSVTFIDTATNTVKHTTYLGRSPHEAFYTRDGKEVWVTVRGESHIAVLDAKTFEVKKRIDTPEGPGMQIFSIDGKYGFVCSSFTPEIVVYDVASHKEVARLQQPSPFCPNLAASPASSSGTR
jgi:YVTN family beta-propeller protein